MQRFSAILLLLVSAAAHSQELHVPEKVMKLDDGVYRLEKFVYGGSFEQRSGDLPGPGCRIVAKDNVIKYYYNETEEGGFGNFSDDYPPELRIKDGENFCWFDYSMGKTCMDGGGELLINIRLIIMTDEYGSCGGWESRTMVFKRDFTGGPEIIEESYFPLDYIHRGTEKISIHAEMDMESAVTGYVFSWQDEDFSGWNEDRDAIDFYSLDMTEIKHFSVISREPFHKGMDPVFRWYKIYNAEGLNGYIYIDPRDLEILTDYIMELDISFNGI